MRLHVHTSLLRGITIRLLARTEMRWQLPLILWVLPLLLAAQAPAKTTGLTATAGPGSGEVTLIWDNPMNSAITRYQFQARVSGSTFGWGNITGSNASTTRHVATGITNNTETDFRVRAFVGNTAGTPSDWATAQAPVVSFNDAVSSIEIEEGLGGSVSVSISPAPTAPFVGNYTLSGTATNGTDFRSSGGTFLVPNAVTTAVVSLVTTDDNVDEPDETIILTLNEGTGYTVGSDSVHTLTIIDNDSTIVSLARSGTGGIDEGETAEFTVILGRSLVAGDTIDVPLSIGGTGVTTDDWSLALKMGSSLNTGVTLSGETTATPQITLAGAGADTATLVLTAIRDSDNAEGAETFTVALGPNDTSTNGFDRDGLATNVGGGADPSTSANSFDVAVTNVAPVTVSFTSTAVTAMEGGTADLTVQLSGARSIDTRLQILTLSTSASENSDFIPGPFMLTISAGQTEKVLSIRLLEDMFDERPETVNVLLSNIGLPAGVVLGSPSQVAITILDNDPTGVELSGSSATLNTGASREFTLRTAGQLTAGQELAVPLTFGGTATRGTDYTTACPDPLPSGVTCNNLNTDPTPTVTFTGPSASSVTLTLTAVAGRDGGGTIEMGLGTLNANSGTDLDGGASGTDNVETFTIRGDGTPLFFWGREDDYIRSIAEDGGTFIPEFAIGGASNASALTINYTISGTATCGTDYTIAGADCAAMTGSFTIPAGAMVSLEGLAPITITLTDDDFDDDGETIILTIPTGQPGFVMPLSNVATLTLRENTGEAAFELSGTPQTGQTMSLVKTADDPDGNGTFGYQWQFRASPSSEWIRATSRGCTGVRSETCTPVYGEESTFPILGGEFRVLVTYTDDLGIRTSVLTTNTIGPFSGGANVVVTDAAAIEGSTAETAAFTLKLGGPPSNDVTMTVTAPEGLLLDGPDGATTFTESEAVTFTRNLWRTPMTVRVQAAEDNVDSPRGRQLAVTYETASSHDAYNGLTGTAALVTITDNDATEVILARSGTGGISEGETAEFTITLGRALVAGDTIDVPLAIGGTGVTAADWSLALKTGTGLNTGVTLSGEDSATPQVRFINAGAQTAALVLTAIRDRDNAEGAETFNVALGPNDTGTNGFDRDGLATNVSGGADPSTSANSLDVMVTNVAPVTVSFTSTAVMAAEGEMVALTVQLSGMRSTDTEVRITTTENSALEADYTPGPFTLPIPAGQTEAVQRIGLMTDEVDELPEEFNVTITDQQLPAGVFVGSPSAATVTIQDNTPTTVTLEGVSDTLAERRTRNFSVTLSRALIAGEELAVPLTYGGTAVQGTHYMLTLPNPLPMGVTYDSTNLTGGIVTFTGPSAASVTLRLRAERGSTRKTVDIGMGTLDAGSGTNLDGGLSGADNFGEFTLFTPLTMGMNLLSGGNSLPEGTTTEIFNFFFPRPLNDTDAEILRFPVMLGGTAAQGTDYTLTCGATPGGSAGITCSNLDSSTPVIIINRKISGNLQRGALSFNINVIADDVADDAETLTLTPTDGRSVNLTFIEAPASVTVDFKIDSYRVSESNPPLTIVFELDEPTGRDLPLPLMYTDITTTTGVDYTPVNTFVIKANGGTIHELVIPIKTTISLTDPDVIDEPTETFTLTMGEAPEGLVKGSRNMATAVIEDFNPTEVTLSGAAGNVAEGGTKEITLSLGRGLVDGEGLAVPLTFAGTATRGTDYTVTCPTSLPQGVTCNDLNTDDAPTVTFTGPATDMTATSVTLTLTATDDEDTESGGETVNIGLGTLNARSGTNLGGGASGTDEVADFRITDDAVPVTVSSLALSVTEAAGNERTADYTVVLNSIPTADVTITVTSSDPAAVTVDTNPSMDGAQSTLTFTSTTWNEPQTVTVSAVDDNMDQNTDRTATLRHRAASSDTNYEGIIIDEVAVMVVDDEATLVTLTAAAGDVREGSTKEITLSLGRGLVDGQVLVVPLTFGGTATRRTDYTVDCRLPRPEGVRCSGLNRSSTPAIAFTAPETGMTAASVTLTLTARNDDEVEDGGETVDIGLGTLNVERSTTLSGGAMGMDNVAVFRIKDPISPPAKPAGFTATAGDKQVTLNWTDPTNSDITGYQFQQKTGEGSFDSWTPIAGSGAATITHTVSGLTNGTAYTFRIRAVAGTLNGAPSDEAMATPANTAPTLANPILNQTATVGTAYSYQFSENTFNDADGDRLTYAATRGDDSTLSTWLTFNKDTRTFSGTPQAGDEGTLSVKVTADDKNGGTVSDVFDLVVAPAPPPALPVITIAAGTSPVTEGTDATFTVTATPAPTADLMVNLSVAEAAGSDFVAGANEGSGKTVTILANSSSATYTVATVSDDTDEPDGSVTVTVTNGTGYMVGSTTSATVMVNDDDEEETLLGAVEDEGETVIVPNPSDSYIEVRSTGTSDVTGEVFKILSLSGKPLLKGTTNTRIDISSLQSGLYLVQLPDGRLLKFVRE